MASSVTGGGDPFTGGAQQRNLAPPGVGGAIGSANTRVSAPVAGVAPTQIKSARPNEGSNIGIPYSRLVPLNNSNKLFVKDHESGKMEWRTETEDLRATTLAFILGVRGKNMTGRSIVDTDTYPQAPGYAPHNVAYQPSIMPGMPGTERFQQLCSLQYLQMYFEQVLSNKTVKLYEPLLGDDGVLSNLDRTEATTGPIGAFLYSEAYATKVGVVPGTGLANQGNPGLTLSSNTMLNVEDIARKSGLAGSQAALAGENYQGIFARDFGPFLKGKGSATQLVSCTVGNNQQEFGKNSATNGTNVAQPFSISRNAGDDLAFAILDAKLMEAGFTDWRPDGIVLSKGVNDPSDKLSDEYLEARDGQLYNIRVQGPAVGTNWTGERSLETLPLDRVFVILIADVWFDDTEAETLAKRPNKDAYNQKRADALLDADDEGNSRPLDTDAFEKAQQEAFANRVNEKTVLCNFRVQVSTSSQMINHSDFSEKGNSHATQNGYKRPRLEGMSRMGLKLCKSFGEYVVGGWQVGQVLDTSASRAVMPQGQLMGVRTAPNTSALNINVQIAWWTADRLARTFNNPEGTVRPRFDGRRDGPKNVVNMQETKDGFAAALS